MTIIKPLEFEVLQNLAKKDETPLWDKEVSYKIMKKCNLKVLFG